MERATKNRFDEMREDIAQLNGVKFSGATLDFTAEPSVEQSLETRIQESSQLLNRIGSEPVKQLKGEKFGMGAASTIAGRTDTNKKDRETTDPMGIDSGKYECYNTNYDTHITYNNMDKYAKFTDFQLRYRDVVVNAIARDRLMIAFNGTSRAENTDRISNPLLEDVNIGFLQKIREHKKGARHLSGYQFGDSGNVNNPDALVLDMIENFIDPWHKSSTDLVVLCGRSILADKYVGWVSNTESPTDRVALKNLMSNKQLGNCETIQVPWFPDNAIAVGLLDALSIYWQTGSRRRTIVDNAKRSRVEDFQSINEDYVVEDFGAWAFVENITAAQ